MRSFVCTSVTHRWRWREWEKGGVIEKACESERKCVCGDKCGSLESGCSRVKKVSADVETWIVCAVWENWGEEQGIFSGLFGIIEVRPSAGVCVGGALVIQRGGRRRGGGRSKRGFGPWAGLVPIRPEARGRFVCTGRTSQRRTEAAWCCSSQPDCHRGSISCSASLSRSSCPHPLLCIPPFHPPLWNKVQKGLLNCLRMFSVYVLFMRVVSRVPVRALGPTVLETEPCDGYVIHMWT